ncbi:epoxide hydrolase 1-like [Palaemon carinicauda]|uniref:epoxide hydrolase 1-like n=1 Tax=Palaemon carinicauda TaxID=392227 RepID=UPI0035B6346D
MFTKLSIASIAITGLAIMVSIKFMQVPSTPALDPDPWWGPGEPRPDDTTIRPFEIDIAKEDIDSLKLRLDLPLRITPPLEGANFTYGMNQNTLEKIVAYWKDSYDWKQREKRLNQYPHFKTQIEGLDIHFLRVAPQLPENQEVKVFPLLMVHGWPGSFVEFYNILPLLTTLQDRSNVVFEVICPSIPGFGFSQSSIKQGLAQMETAQIFLKLMKRLGFEKFYIQGGDWGSLVVNLMATLYPENILGVHTNFIMARTPGSLAKMVLGSVLPTGIVMDEKDGNRLYPLSKLFSRLLRESGYLHIQSTKPDTVGAALNQSPVGLAAYILEKFSTWTHKENPHLPDGGLLQEDFPLSLDQMLDNICVYWFTGTITSSMRYYAENSGQAETLDIMDRIPCLVPAGLSSFPQELLDMPKSLAAHKFYNIVYYAEHTEGGHFIAMERPNLLAQDIHQFVMTVEKGRVL